MANLSFIAAAVLWGVLPGLALARLLPLPWTWAERAAAAPGLSLALVAFTAYAVELVGGRVTPLPVLAATAVLLVLLAAMRRARASDQPASSIEDRYAPWLVWLLPVVIIAQLEPLATIPVLPPSLHDGLDHANWFRLIYETQSLNPYEVLAPPLGPGGAPTYYPWGLHAWMALVARTTMLEPVAVMFHSLVLVSAAIPLSVYLFTAYLTGRGWTAITAAAASLLFWWLPYQVWGWGGYPLLAGAVAALPLCRLALTAVETWQVPTVAAAGMCGFGVLVIHPSQAMFALLAACLVSVTLAAGRELPWRAAAALVLALSAVAAALIGGGALWDPVASFMQRAHDVAGTHGADPRHEWPLGTYLQNILRFPPVSRTTFGALALLGGMAAVFDPRARSLVVLQVVLAALLPLAQYQTWVTSLWYHLPERLWYMQYACLPALAALGVGTIIRGSAWVARRWGNATLRPAMAWPLTVAALALVAHGEYSVWAKARLTYYSRHPQHTFTDRRVLADFEWIRENVPRHEVLFNASADWGLPLPFTGHRTVFWSGGYAIDPSVNWNRMLRLLRAGDPLASQGAAELAWRGVRYVYAASLGGQLERGGRLSLNGEALLRSRAFELLYESPTARVFRIRDPGETLLGLRHSEAVRFEGFHGIESAEGREWRWSRATSRLHIRVPAEGAARCWVRLYGPDPGTYEASIDGAPLALSSAGFRIPDAAVAEGSFVLTITAPPLAPGSGETRELGIGLKDVGLRCQR